MIRLPPLRVSQGQALYQRILWCRDGVPADIDDWTGEMVIRRTSGGEAQTFPVDLTPEGEIVLDVADTSDFPVNVGLGHQMTGSFEIYLRAPAGNGETFQGALVVARRV